MTSRTPIIVINGAPGVGKSTLTQALRDQLNILQTTGTSIIIVTLKTVLPDLPELRPLRYCIDPKNQKVAARTLRKRGKLMKAALSQYIQTALRRGTPMILEGVFSPSEIPFRKKIVPITLAAPTSNKYLQWLNKPTTRLRRKPFPIETAVMLNKVIVNESQHAGIPVIRILSLKARVETIKKILNKRKYSIPWSANRKLYRE